MLPAPPSKSPLSSHLDHESYRGGAVRLISPLHEPFVSPVGLHRFEQQLGRLRRAVRRGSTTPTRILERLGSIAERLEAEGHDILRREWDLAARVEEFESLPSWRIAEIERATAPEDRGDEAPWMDRVIRRILLPAEDKVDAGSLYGAGAGASAGFTSMEGFIARVRPEDEDDEGDFASADPLGTILDPLGGRHRLQRIFFVDSSEGRDVNSGGETDPFQTFWKLRIWFALLEWLVQVQGWNAHGYWPKLYLARGSRWTHDGEIAMLEKRVVSWDFSPVASGACPWDDLGLGEADVHLAKDLARKYLMEKYWDDRLCLSLHKELDGFASTLFLKLPRGVRRISIGAYGQAAEGDPRILGGWTYPEESADLAGFPTRTDRYPYEWLAGTGIRMSIGAMAWGGEVTAPLEADRYKRAWAFFFHENTEVTVKGLRIEGFRGGLIFRGACHDVEIAGCVLKGMYSWGIGVSLIPFHEYLPWKDAGVDGANWAWYPVLLEDCPSDFDIHHNLFLLIGQGTDSAAVEFATCASFAEVHQNVVVACVDGVMSDLGGSGLHVHHNAFLMAMDGIDKKGDGNSIDFKGVRPRTVEDASALNRSYIPIDRWTLVHDNWVMGNTGGALVFQKGTGHAHLFNNYVIDNYIGVGLGTGSMSILPYTDFSLPYTSEVDDPYGLLTSTKVKGWRSPVDEKVERDGKIIFSASHIYIYRNLVAANWCHGMEINEGATVMLNQLPGTDGTRQARALNVEDLVIAHNTVDSNGQYPIDETGTHYGTGIKLARVGKDTSETGWGCGEDSAWHLGDHFLGVAVYNNLVSNNATWQLDFTEESLYAGILTWGPHPVEASATNNVEVRPDMLGPEGVRPGAYRFAGEPLGIADFYYHGLDYNAYFQGNSEQSTMRVATFKDLDSMRINDTSSTGKFHFYYGDSGPTGTDQIAYELNSPDSRSLAYTDLYECDRPAVAAVSGVWYFNFSKRVRADHPGLALAIHYLDLIAAGALVDWWRTRSDAPGVAHGGAAGFADFPNATLHALYHEPIYSAPDIQGRIAGGYPTIGAFQRDG